VISIAYFALVPAETLQTAIHENRLSQLARLDVPWDGETGGEIRAMSQDDAVLPLAFDHAAILGQVVKRLRGKLDYTAIGLELLPPRFTLREVQEIHEAILGKLLTKPAFRRKILDRGLIRATGQRETASAFRPAEYYERA
jgi:8-oxo-dGTP diphosphatase